MSRPISESLSLLSETLGNCKTNLKEKSVENVDNIKISDVDEKIAEIKSGGSSSGDSKFKLIKDVTYNGSTVTDSYHLDNFNPDGANPFNVNFKFTTLKECLVLFSDGLKIDPDASGFYARILNKEKTYTITASSISKFFILIFDINTDGSNKVLNLDYYGYSSN